MTFKEGDVVSRKIGGPLMTVEDIREDDLISTVWFDSNGTVQRDVFAPVTLQKWMRCDELAHSEWSPHVYYDSKLLHG